MRRVTLVTILLFRSCVSVEKWALESDRPIHGLYGPVIRSSRVAQT